MSVATPELAVRLEERLERAVSSSLQDLADLDARPLAVDDQNRHEGATLTCTTTLFGRGWLGQLVVLMPDDTGRELANRISGRSAHEQGGAELTEGLGALSAGIGITFGRAFSDEEQVTVGMPVVIGGSDVSVMFSWGRHFETRLSFHSASGPFWVILRLSHTHRESAG